ncbi:MAG: penicillin-binding protein 2 [Patescibacteria group bacterium]|nr:penicillin-binding protein 2 [Patescibacteria group bacterium]
MFWSKIFAKKNKYEEILPEEIFLDSRKEKLDFASGEGVISKPVLQSHFTLSLLVLFFIFTLFIYKAYSIQITNYELWAERSKNNFINKAYIFAYRGMIKDRNGVPLAWNDSIDNKLEDINSIPKRHYIEGAGFGNLLGFLSYPKQDSNGVFWQDDFKGMEGLEKYYDSVLAGEKGDRVIEVNVKGDIVRDNIINHPKDGQVLNLYIDSKVQEFFYNRLKEVVEAQKFQGGAGVLMDVNTGEVIAAASYPDYDNNLFVNATTSDDKKQKSNYLERKDTPMLNRALAGLYTPGSVVKPFMGYAALNAGVIDQWTNILSTGALVIKNKYGGPDTIFRDWKAHGYVDLRHALAVSSDEYFYQVGGGYKDQEGLGIARIDQYMSMFGFASSTGVDFIGEKDGIIPTPEWKKKTFEDGDWLLGNTYHSAIGQYGFKVSPVSLARSIASIATGGKLVTPRIADTGQEATSTYLQLDGADLKAIREGMHLSASEGGTAHYFNNLPFEVAAKTGTAQLGVNNERVNSWSTGYYPYNDPKNPPKYVFVFLMEGGPANNTVGASKIMREVFQDMLDDKLPYVTFDQN